MSSDVLFLCKYVKVLKRGLNILYDGYNENNIILQNGRRNQIMSQKRVVCYGSEVYHKPGCHYVQKMRYDNQLMVSREEARAHDCRSCRYCNSMNYHMNYESRAIEHFRRKKNMEFRLVDGILYVKTAISCWKIVYVRNGEKLVLYHRNYSKQEIDFKHPENEYYHFQKDVPSSGSIASYLNYIYEHDRYKEAMYRGEKITDFSSKKNERRAKGVEKKRSARRVDYLFRCLEKEHSGYRQLSCC